MPGATASLRPTQPSARAIITVAERWFRRLQRYTSFRFTALVAIACAFTGILTVLTAGNILVFPAIDDAWLELVEKEDGFGQIHRFIYRPLYGSLLDALHPSTRVFETVGVLLTCCCWLLLAWVTYRLWQIVFPNRRTGAVAAAILVIAPIITDVQLVTLDLVLPVSVPVLCGYGALLLTYQRPTAKRLLLAVGLIIASLQISEYTIASVAAALIFLVLKPWLERTPNKESRLTACILFGATVLGYLIFRLTEYTAMRPDTSPSSMMKMLLTDPVGTGLHSLNSVWYCLAGAFLRSAADIRVSKEGSALAAIAFGFVIAVLVGLAAICTRREDAPRSSASLRAWVVLSLALPAALISEFLRQGIFLLHEGRVEPYSTRFCFAAAPIAAIMLVGVLQSFSRRPVLISALVAFIAGHATFADVYSQYRNQQIIHTLAGVLKPYVASNSDFTVAVLPAYYARAYEMTEKVSAKWPSTLSRRLWLMSREEIPLYLHRLPERSGACSSMQRITYDNMGIRRVGKIGQMLWIEPQKDGEFNVESYCVPSDLLSRNPRLPIRNRNSAPLSPDLLN